MAKTPKTTESAEVSEQAPEASAPETSQSKLEAIEGMTLNGLRLHNPDDLAAPGVVVTLDEDEAAQVVAVVREILEARE